MLCGLTYFADSCIWLQQQLYNKYCFKIGVCRMQPTGAPNTQMKIILAEIKLFVHSNGQDGNLPILWGAASTWPQGINMHTHTRMCTHTHKWPLEAWRKPCPFKKPHFCWNFFWDGIMEAGAALWDQGMGSVVARPLMVISPWSPGSLQPSGGSFEKCGSHSHTVR